jgi:hypothetical protein
MRVPPVSERMKEAPAHALRAVFAGIGQVLLVADRIKNRATDTNHAPSAAAPEPAAAASETAAAPADAAAAEAAPAAGTAPVTPDAATTTPATTTPASTAATAPPAAAPATATPATTAPATARPASATPATATPTSATPAATAASAAASAAGDLPVPHYDELSVASLRARMRGLDAAQLRILIDYESTHAERGTVLAMFERRLAKVEAGEA